MKNADFSNILFSIFSPKTLLYSVKNPLNPITVSLKDILKNKEKEKEKSKIPRAKSALNILGIKNVVPKKLYNKYIIDNNNSRNPSKLKSIKNKANSYLTNDIKKTKNKSFSQNTHRINKYFTNNYIITKPKNSQRNNLYNINKTIKTNEEPYKKYLSEKRKIEFIKKIKELENKYILESKRKKKLKFDYNIRTKFQGIDFSKQIKRVSFIEKITQTKMCDKKEEINELDNDIIDKYETKLFLEMLNYEIKEKKYMFIENTNKFIPAAKYNAFKERFRIFNLNLKENPSYSELINYISNS